jgi:hypothetical protein
MPEKERSYRIPMKLGASTGRALATVTVLAALALGACRTSTEDVNRWAATSQGPKKLVAVLTHEKYPLELRVEAALALIRMKPRSGRRVGIQGSDEQIGLIAALAQLPPATRNALVAELVPRLEAEMKKPRPKPTPGQEAPIDTAVPYKDAAFALLTHNGGSLVTDPALREPLRTAIAHFTTTNFAERLDDSTQLYGVEQVMRELKADGVRPLPAMMTIGAAKVDRMAELVADFGDERTRFLASERLVAIAQETASDAWLKQKAPLVEAANKASKLNPPPDQFKKQLAQYQEEELLRVMSSMKRLGGKPVVEFLLRFAEDASKKEKLRSAALVALQGKLDRTSAAHADAVLTIAGAAETPDSVRDAALQRVAEFPRQMVLDKLYGMFDHENWKVRWVAAGLILRMSDTADLEVFFNRLGKVRGMSISEPLRYGGLLASMKGPPSPAEVSEKYSRAPYPAPVRTSALGYYYAVGTRADLPKVEAYERDRTHAPTCKKDSKECEWKCEVTGAGSRETKEIVTLGDFVTYCIKPAMEARSGGKT